MRLELVLYVRLNTLTLISCPAEPELGRSVGANARVYRAGLSLRRFFLSPRGSCTGLFSSSYTGAGALGGALAWC